MLFKYYAKSKRYFKKISRCLIVGSALFKDVFFTRKMIPSLGIDATFCAP